MASGNPSFMCKGKTNSIGSPTTTSSFRSAPRFFLSMHFLSHWRFFQCTAAPPPRPRSSHWWPSNSRGAALCLLLESLHKMISSTHSLLQMPTCPWARARRRPVATLRWMSHCQAKAFQSMCLRGSAMSLTTCSSILGSRRATVAALAAAGPPPAQPQTSSDPSQSQSPWPISLAMATFILHIPAVINSFGHQPASMWLGRKKWKSSCSRPPCGQRNLTSMQPRLRPSKILAGTSLRQWHRGLASKTPLRLLLLHLRRLPYRRLRRLALMLQRQVAAAASGPKEASHWPKVGPLSSLCCSWCYITSHHGAIADDRRPTLPIGCVVNQWSISSVIFPPV